MARVRAHSWMAVKTQYITRIKAKDIAGPRSILRICSMARMRA